MFFPIGPAGAWGSLLTVSVVKNSANVFGVVGFGNVKDSVNFVTNTVESVVGSVPVFVCILTLCCRRESNKLFQI